ncbi:MAG TPA: RNA polymerase sigma factor [Ohtaekwangia sp.]|nr:RNA polymerase sigma factor [Ohtaekwangia sp.]
MFFNHRKKADEELMRLMQAGNNSAFTELYRRYSEKIVRYFYRMLWKDKAKAQDFLHDLFMRIIENPSRFNAERKFSTWLYSVAHNMCKNEYRRKTFRDAVHQHKGLDVIHERIDEIDLSKDEFNDALDRAILELDVEDKNLYALRFELELPLDEIALALECPVGTVKSRIFYLKKKLATQLEEYNPINETAWKII